ncbi:squalene synthase HpnC [Paenalcaligenes niemegkensis]|uniref:squalene synthase HpnC n=1 Tax=Paenalcaligenes niemegkensis TaxID=2895469 RepID=UPI001EE7FB11|nr:squalene synthase HpnC [Paenalcaligenes niemegkensis]MCQ9615631.1 squalene synthase HpnC [Paenalcaligenes niemegkensis]
MSVDHYENFPVASILLPRALRPAVRDIYRFARSADDIADEGNAANPDRLATLHDYSSALDCLQRSAPLPDSLHALAPVFTPLRYSIKQHSLKYKPFYDLLSAFEQDIQIKRYANLEALLDYCKRSANPVGRLMLALFKTEGTQNTAWSDSICSALQLINFWQDVAIDWKKDRVYIPQDFLHAHQINESLIDDYCSGARSASDDENWQRLMSSLTFDARRMLLFGAPLVKQLPTRFALELKFIILGGLRILERLEGCRFDVFTCRPTLTKSDWALLFMRAVGPLPKPHTSSRSSHIE